MNKALIILPLFLLFLSAQSQTNLDSFWNVWQDKSRHDTSRLVALGEVIDELEDNDSDSAMSLVLIRLQFAKKKGLSFYEGLSLKQLGTIYFNMCKYIEALDCYNESELKFKEIGNENQIKKSTYNIGICYLRMGLNRQSITYLLDAYEYSKQEEDVEFEIRTLQALGGLYYNLEDFQKSKSYDKKAYYLARSLNNQSLIANLLINLASDYYSLMELDSAMYFFEKALAISLDEKDVGGMIICYNNIGMTYESSGNYDSAITYYRKSLELNKDSLVKNTLVYTLNCLSVIYYNLKDYQKAKLYASQSYVLAEKQLMLNEWRNASRSLYRIHKKLGNDKQALEYYERMSVIEDSLNVQETLKLLQQKEYENAFLTDSLAKEEEKLKVQHAHELEVQKKNRQKNIYLGIGFLVLVTAFGITRRLIYVRKSRALITKEKDRSENLLLNILPFEIAEELKTKGYADARDFENVTILFTDFCDFTEVSSSLTARELVTEINHCFKTFDGIAEKYKLEKIKTIGDSYMLAGGLPVPDEKAVGLVVDAALEMQEFITNRKAYKSGLGEQAFEMRAGIHTGPVVAGIVGVKKFQYDIWGDTVNIASRIENNGEVGKVNISQTTFDLLQHNGHFTFEKRDKVDVKGKGEMSMYFVGVK